MSPPSESYGFEKPFINIEDDLDIAVESVLRLGFAVVESGFSSEQIQIISEGFSELREIYLSLFEEEFLKENEDLYTMRLPMQFKLESFLLAASNSKVLSIVSKIIQGEFILNQQNGVINPKKTSYRQGYWHRDLPYQNFTTSTPIAINALYCVDDFIPQNGSTWVLPYSHKESNIPSKNFLEKNALQVNAKAGQYIIMNSMLLHAGGRNHSSKDRRAINNLYTIPYIKQQISMLKNLPTEVIDQRYHKLLGFHLRDDSSILSYIARKK